LNQSADSLHVLSSHPIQSLLVSIHPNEEVQKEITQGIHDAEKLQALAQEAGKLSLEIEQPKNKKGIIDLMTRVTSLAQSVSVYLSQSGFGDRKKLIMLLEEGLQGFSSIAGREEEYALKLQGIGRSESGVSNSYKTLAEQIPARVSELQMAFQKTIEPARRISPEMGQVFEKGLAMVKKAHSLAEIFARQPNQIKGLAFSAAFKFKNPEEDLGILPDLLEKTLNNQKKKEGERKALGGLWRKATPILERMQDIALRFHKLS